MVTTDSGHAARARAEKLTLPGGLIVFLLAVTSTYVKGG